MPRPPVAVLLLCLAVLTAGCGGRDDAPATTAASSSAAAPPLGLPDRSRAVVWAVGDGGTGDAHARRVAAVIRRDDPDRVLYLGDVYERGTAREFRRNFAPVYGASLLRRMAPTPGNHEWGRRREGYDPFWRGVRGRRMPYRYAFTVAGWRIISLNTEQAHGPGSAQVRWLRRELRRGGDGDCRMAFWHKPRFSAGRHGDGESTAALWEALRGRARLVLSGHDHAQQRMAPVDGIVQVVSGAGGRDLHDVDPGHPHLAWHDDERRGAVRMVLRPGRAELAFVTAGGDVVDRTALRCRT